MDSPIPIKTLVSKLIAISPTEHPGWEGREGDSHVKRSRTLVGKFELNHKKKPARARLEQNLTPKRYD